MTTTTTTDLNLSVRGLARAAGISPTTAARVKRGELVSQAVLEKVLPFMATCPCCGQQLHHRRAEVAAAKKHWQSQESDHG